MARLIKTLLGTIRLVQAYNFCMSLSHASKAFKACKKSRLILALG